MSSPRFVRDFNTGEWLAQGGFSQSRRDALNFRNFTTAHRQARKYPGRELELVIPIGAEDVCLPLTLHEESGFAGLCE